ncbi:MAG: alpha/beta hydrolase, partial [Chloroflexi bacterium]|nr:alpha/beta hydrolase [Chloroflexota bacterium]
MPKTPINGIELYYESHGEGPAIVFSHGRGGNHLSWWQQMASFSSEYRCITFDHRGWGLTADQPNGPGPKAFVDDLIA